ncbi:hypothetical protein [Nostoc sp. ATCC 53789]|nr:hypothetical protein [Nostoc sp. ATCC 53789]QHG21190.1 hypothetical protein GJB62_35670 [Nostoc sp. ATCC 53789]
MTNVWYWVKGLGIAISGAIVFSGNSAIAKVNQDGNLPNNYGVAIQESITILKGVTQFESNLSRSLKQFSVLTVDTGYFNKKAFCNTNVLFVVSSTSSLNFTDANKFSATVYQHHLNKSNFETVVENYPVSRDNIRKFNYTIDNTLVQNTDGDAVGVQQAQEFLQPIPSKRIVQMFCCMDKLGRCVPCP